MNKHFLIISKNEIILKLYDTDIERAYKVLDSIKGIYKNNVTLISAETPIKPSKHAIY